MSSALSRTLASSFRRRAGSASLGRAGQSSRSALVDRYSTIRTFFRNQDALFHTQSSYRLQISAVLSRASCSKSSDTLLNIDALSLSRQTAHYFHISALRKAGDRRAAPESETEKNSPLQEAQDAHAQPPSPSPNDSSGPKGHHPYWENYPRYLRRLAANLPNLTRPTRDDFLRVANGFWERLRIRFKWFTIRSFRKFNADDISAFITWFVMSQTLWIFIGTTTFFSVIFATANSLRLQEYIARALSNYLTAETGITIIFESAIIPKWKDSRISFKNVYISRRPFSPADDVKKANKKRRLQLAHMAAAGYDASNHATFHHYSEEEEKEDEKVQNPVDDTLRYSEFDLTVDSIDVTLSLWRWLDGKGLVADAAVKGVRGVLDRRMITWDPENPLDPASFRHQAQPGDFELESLKLEDVLITVYQPGSFRPYTASIFRADVPCMRKQWLFYDFLSAENIVGQFDNCLFSLHRPQSIGRTTEQDLKDGKWARMSRLRIDGVNIDHLQNSTTLEGPISWITSGKVDAVFDIKFPQDHQDELPFNLILGEIADAISTAASASLDRIPGQRELAKPPLTAPEAPADQVDKDTDEPRLIIDIDLRFRDVKAAVPLFTKELSYVNSALIRPIVAFINANRTLVPIHCRVVKKVRDFDGCWTMWESGLMDEISLQIYDALAYHVTQANMNRRIKTVSIWSLQMTANAVISGLRSALDPVTAHLRQTYLNKLHPDVLLPEY